LSALPGGDGRQLANPNSVPNPNRLSFNSNDFLNGFFEVSNYRSGYDTMLKLKMHSEDLLL
jgi:hypothetical protein